MVEDVEYWLARAISRGLATHVTKYDKTYLISRCLFDFKSCKACI